MKKFWQRFEVFFCAFILIGMSGITISGAATSKYSKPSAPTDLIAVGGLESVLLKWKAPASNGGQKVISYRVNIMSGKSFYVCKGSSTTCTVPIKNPNKPSAKPAPVWFYFMVAATNSVGTGPDSIVGLARVQIRFRATVDLSNKFAPPTPKPTPTPTSLQSNSEMSAFDGAYSGNSQVSIFQAGSQTPASVTPIPTSFLLANGVGKGSADNWNIIGQISDANGIASVTATNSLYGALTFGVSFSVDPVTKLMVGTGKGTRTITVPVLGDISIEFGFTVARQS